MDNDLDLLFGTLAVQAGYLSTSQLVQAFEAFTNGAAATLAQVLVDHKLITPQARTEIDSLVRVRLDQHQGSVRDALSSVTDANTRTVIRILEEQRLSGTAIYKPAADTLAPLKDKPKEDKPKEEKHVLIETVKWQVESRSRYTLSRVQGKGGLGQVWLAIDGHLNREVALKEVLPKKQADPETASRLMKEAQITGQLEHPNIVPVYELAQGPDEKPFYTMRFLRGQSLSERIKEYRQRYLEEGGANSLLLRELLTVFVSVCNAMAYAHARGVIHRDLKPQNIMLGDFGEVMVVDWGLAKVMNLPDEDLDRRRIQVASADDLGATQDGQLLGSPAYMSPEQADGQVSLLDARTDIYGLGAILFSILAGHAPHQGTQTGNAAKDTVHLMRRISEGPTPRVRTLDETIPKPLDAICAKAMAKKRSERYRTASELADDVTRWLADERISVYQPPWQERLMRWFRRHRTWAQATAAALLLVAVVASTATVLVSRARDRVSLALKSEQQAHAETERALAAERKALDAERLAKAEATRRFKEARDTIDKSLTGVSDALQYFPGVESARRALLEQAADDYERFAEEKSHDPELRLEAGRARLRLGDVRRMLVQNSQAEKAYRSAETLLRELSEAAPQNDEYQLELALCQVRLGILHTTTGPHVIAENYFRSARETLDILIRREVDSPRLRSEKAGALINHALLLDKTNQFDSAKQLLEEAERELKPLEQTNQEEIVVRLAKARSELGQQLLMTGHAPEAVDKIRAAIATYHTLTAQAPDHPPHLEGLAAARISLANAQRILGHDAEVVAAYEASVKDYSDLLKARPGVPHYIESLAVVRTDLAQVLHLQGRNAIAKEQAALALSDLIDLVTIYPGVHRYHEEHATCTQTLGLILRDLDDDANAELAFRDAVRRFEELADAVPDVPDYRRRLASSLSSLGRLLHKLEKHAEAEQSYLAAIAEFQKTIQAGLNDAFTQDPLAWSYSHLADLQRRMDQPEKARVNYAKALVLRESLPTQPEHLHSLSWFLAMCDEPQFRDADRAIQLALQARKLVPDNPRYAVGLGLAYFRAGKWEESIQAAKDAEGLRPQPNGIDSFVLTLAYGKQGDIEHARVCYDRAAQWMQQNSPGNLDLIKLRAESAAALELE